MTLRPGMLAIAVASGFAVASASAAPPANDLCANATPITVPGLNTAATFPGTTNEATSDIVQSSCGLFDEFDVWFRFTAPAAGNYTFDTTGGLLYDTTLVLYSACGGPELLCSNNIDIDNGNFWSAATIALSAGQAVLVRVAANEDTDDFKLNVSAAGTTSNDPCASAQTISLNEVITGSTVTATTDFGLPAQQCGTDPGAGGGMDRFYAFTPPVTGIYRLTMCGSAFDTVLAVLSDCSGTAASVVACNDDSTGCTIRTNSQILSVQLVGGVRYLIRAAGYDYAPADSGTYTVTISGGMGGTCCRGATCAVLTENECFFPTSRAGRSWTAAYSQCNPPGNTNYPCCYADYNKDGNISTQDAFDFLNDWFAGEPYAVVGGSGFDGRLITVDNIFTFVNTWFARCN